MIGASVDLANSSTQFSLQPADRYNPASIVINNRIGIITLYLLDEQLADLADTIQTYLERNRAHEAPDQQAILNQELEENADAH